MFGYVTANHMELKMKDYYAYQAYYCGVCRRLKANHGECSRMVLSYDMAFVSVLLNGLYDYEVKQQEIRCLLHPIQKRKVLTSKMSDYAGDMNILLAYHNLEDDWIDDYDFKSRLMMGLIKKAYKDVSREYPRQHQAVLQYMEQLAICEAKKDPDNIDEAANLTGIMFGEILVYKEDEWSDTLRKLGFALGKFIYYMDAFEDLEEDKEADAYNPFQSVPNETIEEILKMLMAEVTQYFEYLPIIDHIQVCGSNIVI